MYCTAIFTHSESDLTVHWRVLYDPHNKYRLCSYTNIRWILLTVFAWCSYWIFIITWIQFMMNNIYIFLLHCRLTRPGTADSYTKIVWADTRKFGCGVTGYYSSSNGYYTKQYMCLFGPGGNIVGDNSSVYQIGPACSACPASAHACEDGLCV
jgi:hypothetical protein